MEELTAKQNEFPVTLEPYVQQGRMFLYNAAQNLIQYGRVLTEAKPLVPRGQFESWVRANFNMSERSAQGYMQVWKRFGGNVRLQDVQFSNLQKMLALPEGTENQFAEENDLKAMTAREVEQAVRQAKEDAANAQNLALADARAQIQREREARRSAENRLKAAEAAAKEPDRHMIAQIAEKDARIRTLQKQADDAAAQNLAMSRDLQQARTELAEMEEAIGETQREYDQMQRELLDAKSALARGDVEREIAEEFALADFAAAVRSFIGSTAQVPYMGAKFAGMTDEYAQWDTLLRSVEDWAEKARKAMQEVCIDG